MSCHTNQWPIKQGTRKGRGYSWQKTDKRQTRSGHHSSSLQNICQPLVSTPAWEHDWTQLSIRLMHSVSKSKLYTLLTYKGHLLKQRRNGALSLLAMRWSCSATELCKDVKERANFALGQESLWEMSAWLLIVIPWSTAENSAIIIVQADFDEPACVHHVQYDLCSKTRLVPRYCLKMITVNCCLLCDHRWQKGRALKMEHLPKSQVISGSSCGLWSSRWTSKNSECLMWRRVITIWYGFSSFSVTDQSRHTKKGADRRAQNLQSMLVFYLRASQWAEKKTATEPCNWDTSWILEAQRITSLSSMTSLSDSKVIQCSLQLFSALFLTFADCLRGASMFCCQLVVNPQFLTRKQTRIPN